MSVNLSLVLIIHSKISPIISVLLTTLVHAGSKRGKGGGAIQSSHNAVSGITKQSCKKKKKCQTVNWTCDCFENWKFFFLSNRPSCSFLFCFLFRFLWISERVRWHVVVFLLRLALPFLSRPLAFRNLQFRQEMNKQQTRKERKTLESFQGKRCWDTESN